MSIRIIICCILIFFIQVASAGNNTNVWVAKYSTFVESNGSILFENYLIKSKISNTAIATVTVYKDLNQIGTGDFNVNDFKKYGPIGITLLGIKGNYSWISISEPEDKDIWRPLARTQLKWGETYSVEDYTFKVDTFGTDSVNLIISNKTIPETAVFSSDSFKDYRNLRVAVSNINNTGFIDIEFLTNKVPEIKAVVSTDKDEYLPDEPVNVTINVSSDFVQNIVGINVDAGPAAEMQPEHFAATGFTGTQSFESQMTRLPVNSTVTISAEIETRDFYNNPYITTVSKDILIAPVISINKSVPADTDDENVTVRLYVYNSGSNNGSIHVHDTLPDELGSKELDWDIELGSKMTKTFEYEVTPQKPGLYILPVASALSDGQLSVTRKVKMMVHMPYIGITKTAANNENQTEVNLAINNTGDRPAEVKVSDTIPQGYLLAAGSTAWSGKLEAGESAAFRYTLQGISKNIPAASATYRDMRGSVRYAQSNAIEPGVKDVTGNIDKEEKEPTLSSKPSEIVLSMILWFIAIAGIITGVTLVVHLLAAIKRRK
ncbi:Uncharacterised protein [uncultured archaeon]|nr:Uncharacterised protein [uncultured archaeon]